MGSFEVSVDPLSVFKPGDEPSRRAADRENWTCAIENGVGMFGTGILINHNLVLTNYHVIRGLLAQPDSYTGARCRFDYRKDSFSGETSEGRWVAFAADWSVIWSRYSDRDEDGADTGFEQDRLDYAIIKLAESVGNQPVGVDGPARGWLTIPADPDVPKAGATLSIWQHPVERPNPLTPLKAMPLQWCSGKVLSVLDVDLRLRHDVQTFNGSSGAGCFDGGFNFVALHHAGDPQSDINYVGKWNQAIPVAAIVRHLKANDLGQLVGAAPPPPMAAPRRVDAMRDQQLADVVEKRIRAATILMDRDAIEDRITWSRDKQTGNRGIVHVFACRHVDSHRNFLERLVRLSLASGNEELDTKRRKIAAFLGAGASVADGEPWLRESLTWQSSDVSAKLALDIMSRDITTIARSQRRVVVEAAVPIQGINIRRERQLVTSLAQLCAKIGDADRLQVFVVYYDRTAKDGADQTKATRAELGLLWTPKNRPPGCGVCLNFEDISSVDLESWCRALQTRWQTEEGALVAEVETLLGGDLLPMLDAEQRLVPTLRRTVAGRP